MFRTFQFVLVKSSTRFTPLTNRFSSIAKTPAIWDDTLEYYDKLADDWWDPQSGSMKQLHILQPPRMSFICDQLKNKHVSPGPHLLSGLKIVDVGCGVGLLSESLAKLGSNVTGLDFSANSIKMAKMHAESLSNIPGSLEYVHSTAEEHANWKKEIYDAAVVCFILEYIQNREEYIKSCLSLLKPKGSLIIMHANRTMTYYCLSRWHMYVTGIYPKRLFQLRQLLKKDELVDMVCQENCELVAESGVGFPWFGRDAYLTPSESHTNILHFSKK